MAAMRLVLPVPSRLQSRYPSFHAQPAHEAERVGAATIAEC